MANEIAAALIQALPVTGAAIAGWYGLNTWRRQLREGRQVKHAEQALASALLMFRAIRDARSRIMELPGGLLTDAERDAFVRQVREGHLARARRAWERFQERYAVAGLYTARQPRDVAAEVGDCLIELDQLHKSMWARRHNGMTKEAGEALTAFLSWEGSPRQSADAIGARLKAADLALQTELRPVLCPKWLRPVLFPKWLWPRGSGPRGDVPHYVQPP